MKHQWSRLSYYIAYTGYVFVACFIAWAAFGTGKSIPVNVNDKTLHVLAFAALVFLPVFFRLKSCLWVVPLSLIYGACIELLQPAFGRSGSLLDFVADIVGITVGLVMAFVLHKLKNLFF